MLHAHCMRWYCKEHFLNHESCPEFEHNYAFYRSTMSGKELRAP